MKWLKRILKTLGVIVFLVLIGCFVVLEWPGIVVNRSVLKKAFVYYNNSSRHISWKDLSASTHSFSFTRKGITISLGPTCATTTSAIAKMKVCFSDAELGVVYDFNHVVPRLSELGPLVLKGVQADYHVFKKTPLEIKLPSIPSLAENAKLGRVEVDVEHWAYLYQDLVVEGSASTRSLGPTITTLVNGKAVTAGQAPTAFGGQLTAKDPTLRLQGPWQLAGEVAAKPGLGGSARAVISAEPDQVRSKGTHYALRLNYQSKSVDTVASLVGSVKSTHVDGQWRQDAWFKPLQAKRAPSPIRAVHTRIRDCGFDWNRSGSSEAKATISCPIEIEVPPLRSKAAVQASQALRVKQEFQVSVRGNLTTSFPLNTGKAINGEIQAVPGPVFEHVIQTGGEARAEFRFIPMNLPDVQKLDSRLSLHADIPEFEALVSALSGTILAVPAPIQAMRGSVQAKLDGTGNLNAGHGTLEFQTRLNSPKKSQELNLQGEAKLGFERSQDLAKADAELILQKVRLALPTLGLGKLPQLFPDARLPHKPKPPREELGKTGHKMRFEYLVHIMTPPDQPLQIIAKQTSAPVPIGIDLTSTEKNPLYGTIDIRKVPIHLGGISQGLGQIVLHADATNRNGILTGEAIVSSAKAKGQPVKVPATQAAGQAAGEAAQDRTAPQFSVPITAIASALVLGTPLELVSTQGGQGRVNRSFEQPKNESEPIILKFRHRY